MDEKDDFKLINELEKYAGGLFKIAKNPDWETAKEEYKKHKESTNIVTDEPNYWILKINHGNSKDNEWENVKKGVLAIGWGNTLDPTKVSLEELKKDLHEVHKNDKKYTVNKLNGWAKTILTFAKEIKINDKVIICDGYNETGEEVHVFGVAKVTGNYLFDVKSTWVWKNKIGADIKSIDKKIKIDILRKLFNMGTLMGTLHGTLKGKKIDKSLFDNFSKMIKKETGESIEF
ncbi:MAG: hypothetical protein NTX03_01895 [Bacteroidetes bacterium]|nr:hypothetical protein [Bacteroidota bacterium]